MSERRIYVMSDFDDGYGMSPQIFGWLADCINGLLDSPTFELSEIANRANYAPGAQVTLYSARYQYGIEVDAAAGTVSLSVVPMDEGAVIALFMGRAKEE